jgi:hypothetical protein
MAESEERPWEQPGRVRRDCAPHRGALLLVLATLSVVLGWLSWCLVVPSVVGLPLAVAAFVMSRHDLGRLRAGLVASDGWGQTSAAWHRSIDGLCLNVPVAVFFVLALVCFLSRV